MVKSGRSETNESRVICVEVSSQCGRNRGTRKDEVEGVFDILIIRQLLGWLGRKGIDRYCVAASSADISEEGTCHLLEVRVCWQKLEEDPQSNNRRTKEDIGFIDDEDADDYY